MRKGLTVGSGKNGLRKLVKDALEQGSNRVKYQPDVYKQASENFVTLAQLQAEARQGVRRLQNAKSSLKAELSDLSDRIPVLVREIWGSQSEVIVGALRQRQQLASKLIRQWEDAEHRLIAVANSLVNVQAGQKFLAVGVPLAASHLMLRDAATAQCYHSPTLSSTQHLTLFELNLQRLFTALNALATAISDEIAILLRGTFLFLLFLPVAVTSPALNLSREARQRWLKLLLWTLERAGPAFIKWGQWAATRPDLFAPDLCTALAALQTKAPAHAFHHSKRTVEEALGMPLDTLFVDFECAPVASGSIAQVHKAVLSAEGARLANLSSPSSLSTSPTTTLGGERRGGLFPLKQKRKEWRRRLAFTEGSSVAVKVRHPGAALTMERDFSLMQRGAALLSVLPFIGGPQLKESLMQFGAPLRDQMDLRSEAAHLDRFTDNFSKWRGITFPLPAAEPLVSAEVLVESFEEGDHISTYVDQPITSKYNKKLAELGMNSYLKMLLNDNFIHADLHPGNILVRLEGFNPRSFLGKLAAATGLDFKMPKLVLLDVGMIAKLTQDDQRNLLGFFKSLTKMDGSAVADAIMSFAHELPPNPAAFKAAMGSLFSDLDPDHVRQNTQAVISDMMDTVREHGVHLQGSMTTVVITSMVLEGWSTKLDPDIRIMEALKEVLPREWHERMDKSIDSVMGSSALAMA